MKIISTLASIAPQIWEAQTLEQARTLLLNHLSGTEIKDKDKMIQDVNRLTSLQSLHRYTANALLKYEGLGTKLS